MTAATYGTGIAETFLVAGRSGWSPSPHCS
jgi:hypothetical protein